MTFFVLHKSNSCYHQMQSLCFLLVTKQASIFQSKISICDGFLPFQGTAKSVMCHEKLSSVKHDSIYYNSSNRASNPYGRFLHKERHHQCIFYLGVKKAVSFFILTLLTIYDHLSLVYLLDQHINRKTYTNVHIERKETKVDTDSR